MNTTKLIPFLLICGSVIAQPALNIWEVNPDTICAGDTIYVNFKFTKPNKADNTINEFKLGSNTLWSGNWSTLAALDTQMWNGGPQWTYIIKLVAPSSVPVGSYTVYGVPAGSFGATVQAIYVKDCCTLSTQYSVSLNGMVANFQSTSTGTTASSVYNWDVGNSQWQVGGPSFTFTYSIPGNYNTKLKITNPTCEVVNTQPVNVMPVGIKEYQREEKPLYFDLYGNPTNLKPGEILIEQRGNVRTKVLSR